MAADAASTAQAKRDRARWIAKLAVLWHGLRFAVEPCNLSAWTRFWGRALHAFSPGMLLRKSGGTALRPTPAQCARPERVSLGAGTSVAIMASTPTKVAVRPTDTAEKIEASQLAGSLAQHQRAAAHKRRGSKNRGKAKARAAARDFKGEPDHVHLLVLWSLKRSPGPT